VTSRVLFFALVALATATFGAVSEKSPWLPNRDIDVREYRVTIHVPKLALGNLKAHVEIDFVPLNDLEHLQLHSNQKSIEVRSVVMNGEPLSHSFPSEGILQINFSKVVRSRQMMTVEISYQITAHQLNQKTKGLFFTEDYRGTPVFNVQDWPYHTRLWVPSNDAPQDPARFKVEAHVPDGTMALSNGLLEGDDYARGSGLDASGLRIYRWAIDVPVPTYGLNLVVGDYRVYRSELCFRTDQVNNDLLPCDGTTERLPLNLFVPKTSSDDSFWRRVQQSAKSVVFYSSLLGKYPYPKVAFVDAPQDFNMEYPSLITGSGSQVHELAHHWWGDSVYIQHWGDFWISEGFATFFDGLYAEFRDEKFIRWDTMSGKLSHPEDTDPNSIFDDTPYLKGATALHEIRVGISRLIGVDVERPEVRNLVYQWARDLYRVHRLRHLGTDGLKTHLIIRLPGILQANGYSVNEGEVVAMVDTWSKKMFSDPPMNFGNLKTRLQHYCKVR
jgi:aminopeptidase N